MQSDFKFPKDNRWHHSFFNTTNVLIFVVSCLGFVVHRSAAHATDSPKKTTPPSHDSTTIELTEGGKAPLFETKNQNNISVKLASRKSQGWTVLYFYPKAGTPGCTKQACAFRDASQKIKNLGAEIYGISTDSVTDLKKFHGDEKLNFDLLSDETGEISKSYGLLMPTRRMANRWTFLIDDHLTIRWIEKDVDPALDAIKIMDKITSLKNKKEKL